MKFVSLIFLTLTSGFLLGGCSDVNSRNAGVVKSTASTNHPGQVRFIAGGDMPYNSTELNMLSAPDGEFVRAIEASAPSVLIYVGDIKGGSEVCTDALLKARFEMVANLYPHKTVFTPGDNDWTDCDRTYLKIRFDELERLDFLRQLFFHGEGANMTRDIPGLVHQAEAIENMMWQSNNVLFASVHMVATNNGREEIFKSDIDKALEGARQREALNEAWINQLFANAKDAAAIVLSFHTDPYLIMPDTPWVDCTATNPQACDSSKRFREHIERKAHDFDKPVLIVHGNTNGICFDQPAFGLAPNLWRVNVPGDNRLSDMVQISVDVANKQQPFDVKTLLGQQPLPQRCNYEHM